MRKCMKCPNKPACIRHGIKPPIGQCSVPTLPTEKDDLELIGRKIVQNKGCVLLKMPLNVKVDFLGTEHEITVRKVFLLKGEQAKGRVFHIDSESTTENLSREDIRKIVSLI